MSDFEAIAMAAAVDAYDAERCRLNRLWYGSNCPTMSDENKANIAPMIKAAITAYVVAHLSADEDVAA